MQPEQGGRVTTVDPAIETASEAGRTLDLLGAESAATASAGRRGTPFAARFQAILIALLFVGFVLIAQRFSKSLYQIGLPLLVLAAFLQIAFGNIPPTAGFAKSMRLLVLTWVIVAAVFGLGIVLAPYLIGLGR